MPVTKITLDYPRTKSFFVNSKCLEETPIEHGVKEAKLISDRFDKIGDIVNLLKEFPNADVEKTIKLFCGEDQKITIDHKTKKQTTYWIPNLFIHVTN